MSLPSHAVGCAKAVAGNLPFTSHVASPLPLPTAATTRNKTATARVTCQLDASAPFSGSHAKKNLSAKVSSLSDPAIGSTPADKPQSTNGAIKSTAGKDAGIPTARRSQTRKKISQEDLQKKVDELRNLYSKVDEVRESYVPPDIFAYYENVKDFIDLPNDTSKSTSADWPLSLFSPSGLESTRKADQQANVARFFCPLDAKPIEQEEKIIPRLFYLPGIEGTGAGLSLHHKALARLFEVTCLNIPLGNRTNFMGLVHLVEEEVKREHQQSPGRALVILAESFGCLLALAVAARNPKLPLTLVIVNPATSFPRSQLQPIIPLLPLLPSAAYQLVPYLLSFTIGNPLQMASSGVPYGASQAEKLRHMQQTLLDLLPVFPMIADILPQATLNWRLRLLEEGSPYVEALLPQVSAPTLIVAGHKDSVLPSEEEARRLKRVMKKSKIIVRDFQESGHALLLEGGMSMATVIKGSGLYRRSSRRTDDPNTDSYTLPTVEELAQATSTMAATINYFCSPVFLSTETDTHAGSGSSSSAVSSQGSRASSNGTISSNNNGSARYSNGSTSSGNGTATSSRGNVQQVGNENDVESNTSSKRDSSNGAAKSRLMSRLSAASSSSRIVRGLGGVPATDRPILFVGNHQTYAPDLPIIIPALLKEGIPLRGLTHPIALGMGNNGTSLHSPMAEQFRVFGAVPVSAQNAYKLMANGEAVLLFPGGGREALRKKGEEYQLFWPDRAEFVRMAIKMEATIVPFAAVGVDDGYNIILDGDDISRLPIPASQLEEFQNLVPQIRDESVRGAATEEFIPPVFLPKAINRLYFLFRQPIRTSELQEELGSPEAASELYQHVKSEVEAGLDYLLEKREEDPYKDLVPRLMYEAPWGESRQAPTFEP